MNILRRGWDKANGKKTVAGIALALVAVVLNQLGLINVEQFITLLEIAGAVSGIGILHKIVKMIR